LNVNASGALEVVLGNGTHLRTPNAPGAVIPPGPYLAIVASDVPDLQDSYHMFGAGQHRDAAAELHLHLRGQPPSRPHARRLHDVGGGLERGHGGGSGGPATAKSTGAVSNSSLVGSAVKKMRGTLVGTISSVGRTTLSLDGKGVSSLKSGRYKLTVDDRTPKGGFAIEHGNSPSAAITGPSFVGRHTVTVYLSAGRWAFSSSTGAKHAFVVVA
jgi:hypothetical protein